jgi:hypothetical protein
VGPRRSKNHVASGKKARSVPVADLVCGLLLALIPAWGCKSSQASSVADGGSDGAPTDAGPASCQGSDAGPPLGIADDFGPNAKATGTSSALGQLDVYEVTTPRTLEWLDLYLRADLGGTRLTIAVYEAAARNAVFRRLTTVRLDLSPCTGWVGSGPLGVPLEPGRFYALGYDPNQAVTSFVDSEASNLPVDGQFGRLIGARTSTSVSLDTLDWGTLSVKDFTRQRLFTSPRAGSDGSADVVNRDASGDLAGDAAGDRAAAADATGG